MKITCQACQSKYTIADDKIQGKVAESAAANAARRSSWTRAPAVGRQMVAAAASGRRLDGERKPRAISGRCSWPRSHRRLQLGRDHWRHLSSGKTGWATGRRSPRSLKLSCRAARRGDRSDHRADTRSRGATTTRPQRSRGDHRGRRAARNRPGAGRSFRGPRGRRRSRHQRAPRVFRSRRLRRSPRASVASSGGLGAQAAGGRSDRRRATSNRCSFRLSALTGGVPSTSHSSSSSSVRQRQERRLGPHRLERAGQGPAGSPRRGRGSARCALAVLVPGGLGHRRSSARDPSLGLEEEVVDVSHRGRRDCGGPVHRRVRRAFGREERRTCPRAERPSAARPSSNRYRSRRPRRRPPKSLPPPADSASANAAAKAPRKRRIGGGSPRPAAKAAPPQRPPGRSLASGPKPKSPCGCAAGDLQCQIRCSATGH